jgi:F0F1-type ATP synthase assembly protein I
MMRRDFEAETHTRKVRKRRKKEKEGKKKKKEERKRRKKEEASKRQVSHGIVLRSVVDASFTGVVMGWMCGTSHSDDLSLRGGKTK